MRQKYDPDLGKWMTAALRKLGYDDDKGAALGSTAAFKMQHDLGQNLIYLHVFPRFVVKSAGSASGADGGDGAGDDGKPQLDLDDPATRCIQCEIFDFHKLVPSKVVPWSQKRRLLSLLQNTLKKIENIEGKMASRQALDDSESLLYEIASRQSLDEKIAWLQAKMKEQVTEAVLTDKERGTVLSEMEEKLASIDAEIKKTPADGKQTAKLSASKDSLASRHDSVKSAFSLKAAVTYPVKGLPEIKKIKIEVNRLDKLEKAQQASGKSMTASEALKLTRELDARIDLNDRLQTLYHEAKGWFESQEEFEERVKEQLGSMGGPGGKGKR